MRIPKQILKKMINVAASESTRYSINGVRFKREGDKARADATDGRMMLRAQWTDETGGAKLVDIILPASSIKATKLPARITDVVLCKSEFNGSATIRAVSSRNASRFDMDVADQDVETIDAHFPRVDDVVPNYADDECTVIGVDPFLLSRLLDTLGKIATNEERKGVRLIVPHNSRKPIRIDAATDDVVATGVLMPVNLQPIRIADAA